MKTLSPAEGTVRLGLLEQNAAAVLFLDAAGGIIGASHGPRGEPERDIVGRSAADLVPPDQAGRLRAAVATALAGAPDSLDVIERGPQGATHAWRVDAAPAPGGATLVFTDVTDLVRERERLRRSETILVDAQGVAHMGTWDWDITQPNATWSQELYRIYGLTPETYTPSYEAYLTKVHPDDRARVIAATEACFKEHRPYSHDERIFRPDGEIRWLHTWAVPVLDESGKLARLLGVCQDVTEQKRAETAMRAQMMTRALARRLLDDLTKVIAVPERAVREMGRGIALERKGSETTPEAFAQAFSDMGFGQLRFEGLSGGRYQFRATDLLERRQEANLPTCFLTLGFLEGAVAALSGHSALGSEMRCQSIGHEACTFIVRTQ